MSALMHIDEGLGCFTWFFSRRFPPFLYVFRALFGTKEGAILGHSAVKKIGLFGMNQDPFFG